MSRLCLKQSKTKTKTNMNRKDIKEKLKAFYDWQKANIGTYTDTFTPLDGVTLSITYSTCLGYGDYDFTIEGVSAKVDKSYENILAAFGVDFDEVDPDSDMVVDTIAEYLSKLVDEAYDMHQDLSDEGVNEHTDIDELYTFASFEKLWSYIDGALGDESEEFSINDEYTAVFDKGSKYVTVGCQDIEIDKIRELVEAYDAFQND